MTRHVSRRDVLASTSLGAGFGLAGCSSVLDLVGGGASCGDVELTDTRAKPANTIPIEGFGEGFGDEPLAWVYDATVEDPGEDDRHPAYVERTGETTAQLVVPVHPSDYMGGGPAELVIESEDGNTSCAGLEFDIEPLDPAPGTLETLVDDVENALVQGGETFGFSKDELLAATPTELPPHVSAIAAGLRTIDGPDTSHTVRSMLAGESGHFGDGQSNDAGLAVVEAVANESGFVTELTETANVLTEIGEAPAPQADSQRRRPPREGPRSPNRVDEATGGTSGESVDTDGVRHAPRNVRTDSFDGELVDSLDPEAIQEGETKAGDALAPQSLDRLAAVDPEPVDTPEISSASDLDHWMDVQSRFARANQGAAAASRDFGGFVIAGAAFVPGAQGAAGAAGATLVAMDLVIDLAAKQLPSSLDLTVHADPALYDEDEDDTGWLFTSTEAYSEGFSFSLPDALGVIPGSGKIAKVTGRLMGQTQGMVQFGEAFLDFVQASTAEAWETSESSAPIEFPPGLYGPFDLEPDRDEAYFEWEFETVTQEDEEPFEFIEEEWEYEPQGVGRAKFSIWTDDDAFGDASGEGSVDLEVQALEVIIREAETNARSNIYRLNPEEEELTLDLYTEVENAEDETVEWTVVTEEGPGQPYLSSGGEFNAEATFDAEMLDFSEDERGVYRVTAESMTEDGLREGREPPRTDSVTVIVTDDPDFRVSDVSCVTLDDSHQFLAFLGEERLDFGEIDWQVSGRGSLNSNGVFTPTSEGDVEIEFEYETESGNELTDEVSFEVSEFCSNISVTSLDSGYFNHAEGCVGYSERPSGDGPEKRLIISTPRDTLHVDVDIVGEFPDGQEWEGEWTWEEITDGNGTFSVEGYRPDETLLDIWQTSTGCSGNPYEDNTGTLERTTEVIDGESVVVYNGRLEQRIGRLDIGPNGVCTRVLVEFSNVVAKSRQDCLD